MESALQQARVGNSVVLEGDGETFHLERIVTNGARLPAPYDEIFRIPRTDFRPLGVILSDPTVEWSDVTLDDQWERDMTEVMAYNRAHDRDPWAE